MCGIAGIIGFGQAPIQSRWLMAMLGVLSHRGPDDEGYLFINQEDSRVDLFSGACSPPAVKRQYPELTARGSGIRANIGLGHRRFSILDTTSAGHQPFVHADRCCAMVHNGEIYNYLEIKKELEGRGALFQSRTDTEVFLAAYRQWGVDCFHRLNGFWAAAIYDFQKRHLILSRDRMGKKPLFWARLGDSLWFASEIKALLKIPELFCRRRVNETALRNWLSFGQKDLDDETFFKGIFKLPAGCWTMVDKDFPKKTRRFWRLPDHRLSAREISVSEATATLRDTLSDAVRIRLRADVPLGVELSGGMDSSALAALASGCCHPHPLAAFTVRFKDPRWDEGGFARSVVAKYNLRAVELSPRLDEFWKNIRAFTYLEEEPFHSPNLQTNQQLWARMRHEGVKVSLNGAGGDELFAGYQRYFPFLQLELLRAGDFHGFIRNSARHTESGNLFGGLSKPVALLARRLGSRLFRPKSFVHDGIGNRTARPSSPYDGAMTLSSVLQKDMTRALMPYWLASGDRGYMGIPVEVRAPFLDFRLVEFAFTLPVSYLIRDGWHKWILRKALEDLLPPEVVWRRHKMGFPFPYRSFRIDHQRIFSQIVTEARNPYVRIPRGDLTHTSWRIISFLLWYELFFNENASLFESIEAHARQDRCPHGVYQPAFLKTCAVKEQRRRP